MHRSLLSSEECKCSTTYCEFNTLQVSGKALKTLMLARVDARTGTHTATGYGFMWTHLPCHPLRSDINVYVYLPEGAHTALTAHQACKYPYKVKIRPTC